MKNNKNNCLNNLETDIIYFLNMCSDDDKAIYAAEPKEKKIEDFGRFICLGLAFNMRGVFLSMIAQYEKVGDIDDIFNYLNTVSYEQIENWVDKFSEKIDDKLLKKCALSIWDEKKEYFTKHKFELWALLQ